MLLPARRLSHRARPIRSLALLGLTVALLSGTCGGCRSQAGTAVTEQAELEPVTLALNWFPEAEHGGYYAALVHGYFEQEGLDVTIQSGGPGAPIIQQVATERVPFAVANADQVLLGRDQQAPVVAVMTAMQNSPRCIMVHEKSGPSDLRELRDVTLAVGSGKPFAKFLLNQLGPDAGLQIIPYQGSVAMFLERQDFAQQAYVFSEPFVALRQGGDPRCLMLSDLGFNPYASLLVTNDRLVTDRPDLVGKMVRASLRGWRKYLDEPETTNRYIHELNREMEPEILAYGAEQLRPLCLPPPDGSGEPDGSVGSSANTADSAELGRMTAERWEQLAGQLGDLELLEDPEVWKQAYDLRFWEQAAETPQASP